MKELNRIYDLVRDEVKPIIEPLLKDATYWSKMKKKYQSAMDGCPLDNDHLKEYKAYNKMLKEAQTQYIAVIKVLLSTLRRDAVEEKDEFEEYLKSYGME